MRKTTSNIRFSRLRLPPFIESILKETEEGIGSVRRQAVTLVRHRIDTMPTVVVCGSEAGSYLRLIDFVYQKTEKGVWSVRRHAVTLVRHRIDTMPTVVVCRSGRQN